MGGRISYFVSKITWPIYIWGMTMTQERSGISFVHVCCVDGMWCKWEQKFLLPCLWALAQILSIKWPLRLVYQVVTSCLFVTARKEHVCLSGRANKEMAQPTRFLSASTEPLTSSAASSRNKICGIHLLKYWQHITVYNWSSCCLLLPMAARDKNWKFHMTLRWTFFSCPVSPDWHNAAEA